jgi:hypothetical protein
MLYGHKTLKLTFNTFLITFNNVINLGGVCFMVQKIIPNRSYKYKFSRLFCRSCDFNPEKMGGKE